MIQHQKHNFLMLSPFYLTILIMFIILIQFGADLLEDFFACLFCKKSKMIELEEYSCNLLNILILGSDPFAGCPEEIFALKSLSRLNLSFQGLNRLTEKVESLTSLEELNLAHNPLLETLPGEISALTCLRGNFFKVT